MGFNMGVPRRSRVMDFSLHFSSQPRGG